MVDFKVGDDVILKSNCPMIEWRGKLGKITDADRSSCAVRFYDNDKIVCIDNSFLENYVPPRGTDCFNLDVKCDCGGTLGSHTEDGIGARCYGAKVSGKKVVFKNLKWMFEAKETTVEPGLMFTKNLLSFDGCPVKCDCGGTLGSHTEDGKCGTCQDARVAGRKVIFSGQSWIYGPSPTHPDLKIVAVEPGFMFTKNPCGEIPLSTNFNATPDPLSVNKIPKSTVVASPKKARSLIVKRVGLNSPAAIAGILVGDKIIQFGSEKIEDIDRPVSVMENEACAELFIIVQRKKERIIKKIDQMFNPVDNKWQNGAQFEFEEKEILPEDSGWCFNHPTIKGTKHTLTLGGITLCPSCCSVAIEEKYKNKAIKDDINNGILKKKEEAEKKFFWTPSPSNSRVEYAICNSIDVVHGVLPTLLGMGSASIVIFGLYYVMRNMESIVNLFPKLW